jgi:hypothetical protein
MLVSLEKEWKKALLVLGIYTIWWVAFTLTVISLQGVSSITQPYESVEQFYLNQAHTIIKGAIIYYILIFKLSIQWIRTRKRKKILLQYLLFFLLITVYEYIWNFKMGTVPPAIRTHFTPGIFVIVDLGFSLLMAIISF